MSGGASGVIKQILKSPKKRAPRLGDIKCRGCQREQPVSRFAANQVLDFDCKRIRDNLWKIAKRSHELKYFEEIEQDPVRFKRLLIAYDKCCPQQVIANGKVVRNKGKKESKFTMAWFKSTFEATVEVSRDTIGQMMTFEEFQEWGMSLAGKKRKTPQQSIAEWQVMVDNKGTMDARLHDTYEGEPRFWIRQADKVVFSDKTIQRSILEV